MMYARDVTLETSVETDLYKLSTVDHICVSIPPKQYTHCVGR